MAIVVFQSLHVYSAPAFRHPSRALFRIAGGWTAAFLVVFAGMFFFKLDGVLSRVWMATWFLVGFGALVVERVILAQFVALLVSAGRLQQRAVIVGGGAIGADLLRELAQERRSRSAFARRLRRPQRRALAQHRRGLSEAGQRRRSGRLRPLDPGRPGHFRPADHRRAAHLADAAQALGAADRHSAGGPRQPAEFPAAVLFLRRQGAGARLVRQADRRLGHRHQAALRRSSARSRSSLCRRSGATALAIKLDSPDRCFSSRSAMASTTS